MKNVISILFLLLACHHMQAQYYVRGEIRDEKNNPLQNVRIVLHSTGLLYASGIGGAFGILSSMEKDTLTCSLDGYESMTVPVHASRYIHLTMKMLPFTASMHKHSLLSLTKNLDMKPERNRVMGDETYNTLVENEFINTASNPETGVVLNVDRASYSNIRRFISQGSEVPPDAVRIEEMLNYFSINYSEPAKDSIFRVE
ncbi:MAG: von Willebrand factor type A domain-containing protein [Chitinophagaceae bacterium]|nr:von Willebrand factor type A domain-containing protein [Chitinophagaceae bacterium]